MKHISIVITSLVALLLAACGNDDIPVSGNMEAVSITAAIDHGMASRAVTDPSDDLPVRAILWYKKSNDSDAAINWTEVISKDLRDNAFTFNVELDKTETYDIVVWADDDKLNLDEGDGIFEPYSILMLRSSIAFSGRILQLKPSDNEVSLSLTHVVAKLMVNETGTLDAGDKVKLSFTQTEFTYNPLDNTYFQIFGGEPVDREIELTVSETENNSGNLFTYYYLAPPSDHEEAVVQDVKLTYVHHAKGDRVCEKTITNVPIHANRRTIISGSFKDLDIYADIAFNVTTDDNWNDSGEVAFPLLYNKDTDGDLATYLQTNVANTTGRVLRIKGEIGNDDFKALKKFLSSEGDGSKAALTLDLSSAEIKSNSIPNEAFGSFQNYETTAAIGLKAVILPPKVTTIVNSAFRGCTNLQSINL